MKSINPHQPEQFAQADLGQNFSLQVNFLYVKGPEFLMIKYIGKQEHHTQVTALDCYRKCWIMSKYFTSKKGFNLGKNIFRVTCTHHTYFPVDGYLDFFFITFELKNGYYYRILFLPCTFGPTWNSKSRN